MAKNFEGRLGFLVVLASLLVGAGVAQANPSGGSIAAGSATISGTGTPSVTINQLSNTAIINWNSFSIGAGELTTFVQPSAASAVLNRVTGGGITSIDGTLNANGQVFIINGNGIYIGKSGAVNTAGFTASTLDISNADFLKNSLQFSGSSSAGVQNFGTITAAGGDIYLIGQTVDNEGSLSALNGTVGLAAAQSVLITQSGAQHVFVSSTPSAKPASTATGVTNNGSIAATAAELRAANGNMYALAINNGGTIRATTVQKQGGHVYLTSDSGVIVNTGTVDASASVAKGVGGAVQFKTSSSGTVVNHGAVISHGGQGGTGGTVDLSGGTLDFAGGVDLTSPGGKTGSLLLDPQSIEIIGSEGNGVVSSGTTTSTTYTPAPGYPGVSTLYNATLEAQLGIAQVIVDGVTNVTVNAPINWTSGNPLILETTGKGGTININAAITGMAGSGSTLYINCEDNGYVTTDANGTVSMDNFTLEAGIWQQILTTTAPTAAQLKAMPGLLDQANLPAFDVTNDFQLDGTSTFERFAGGNGLLPTARAPGNSPYVIDDIFALQGIGSPSDTLLNGNYILGQDINYDPGTMTVTNTTINWNADSSNGGAGFVPIGEGGTVTKPFTGTLNGDGFIVAGFYYDRPNDDLTGLFGEVSGKIENLDLDLINSYGLQISSALVGRLNSGGLINNCVVTGDALAEPAPPANPSTGTTDNQSQPSSASLEVSAAFGGLVGEVLAGGTVENSESFISYELLGTTGASGLTGIGGLAGVNYGTITNCSSGVAGTTSNSVQAFAGEKVNTPVLDESISIGGLVGANFGTINGGECMGDIVPVGSSGSSAASVISGTGNFNVGGFVGVNYGKIDGTVRVGGATLTYQAFSVDSITVPSGADVYGGIGSYYVGGFVGANYGTITNGYSAPQVDGLTDTVGTDYGTVMGGGAITINNNLQPPDANGAGGEGALGDIAVGGFAGANFGTITHSGTEDVVVANGDIEGVGDVTTYSGRGVVTAPEPANFKTPLDMDSIFVGGFVGLGATGSKISGSFSDPNAVVIGFTLDPTAATPTAAPAGDNFALVGPGSGAGALVTSSGDITGGTGYYIVGGFAGGNYGAISTSFSSGDVSVSGTTDQSNSFFTGGFAGVNSGTIADAFESGDATSTTTSGGGANDQTGVVGGLVAQMNAGSVSYTYETGAVTGGTTRGGLIGVDISGSALRSFWDTSNNAGLNYSAGGAGAMGETNASLDITPATEPTSIYHTDLWNFTTIWVAPATAGPPTLQNVP